MLTKEALAERAEHRKRIVAQHDADKAAGKVPQDAKCLPIVSGSDSFCAEHMPPTVENEEQAKAIAMTTTAMLNAMVPDALAMADGDTIKAGEIMDLLGCPICYLEAKRAVAGGDKGKLN